MGIVNNYYCLVCNFVAYTFTYELNVAFRYSRYLLWMEVSPTNNDPRVILKYYLDAIAARNGVLPARCPLSVQLTYGSVLSC